MRSTRRSTSNKRPMDFYERVKAQEIEAKLRERFEKIDLPDRLEWIKRTAPDLKRAEEECRERFERDLPGEVERQVEKWARDNLDPK